VPEKRAFLMVLTNHLDRELDWNELAGIAEDAYAGVAPTKLVERARAGQL
jgi:hypothetical protein